MVPPSLPGPAGAAPQPELEKELHIYGKSFSLPFLSLLRLLAMLCDSYLVSAEPLGEVIQEVQLILYNCHYILGCALYSGPAHCHNASYDS